MGGLLLYLSLFQGAKQPFESLFAAARCKFLVDLLLLLEIGIKYSHSQDGAPAASSEPPCKGTKSCFIDKAGHNIFLIQLNYNNYQDWK